MTRNEKQLIRFVAAQAVVQLNVLAADDRSKLLDGLRILLEPEEFEQCEILDHAISDSETAKLRSEEAQLLLGEILQAKNTRR